MFGIVTKSFLFQLLLVEVCMSDLEEVAHLQLFLHPVDSLDCIKGPRLLVYLKFIS